MHQEVIVPDFPPSPFLMVSYFKKIYEDQFQAYKLTNEDLSKTSQYIANSDRNIFKKSFTTVEEYLKSLEMELTIYEASIFTIPRIAQMTQKTNQFNLTTFRYTEDDIKNKIKKGELIHCLSVKDKFGDNGIAVLSIIQIENNIAFIDTLLLSCRLLGRNIEGVYLNFIINLLFDKNITEVRSSYLPSNKNKQTKDFYEKMNFNLVETKSDGSKYYSLQLTQKRNIENYYTINYITNE
jgi:FkbH-like protein